jgi:hypothetical protein
MTCETVLHALLERPLTELDDLRPHLETCPRCAAALRALTAGEAAIAQRLDTFARGGDLPRALDAAATPPTPHRSWIFMFAVAAAVAAVLALPPFVRARSAAPVPEPPAHEAAAPAAPPGPRTRSVDEAPEPPPEQAPPAAPDAPDAQRSSVAPEPPVPCVVDLPALQDREGQLDAATRACLEQVATGTDGRRADASRLLVHDAFARRDLDAWTRLAERHLTSVDPDDGYTAYLVALMASQLPGHEADGIRFAELGLAILLREPAEGRAARLARSRAETLYKVRVQASQARWNQAMAAGEPAAEDLRAQTLEFATEWHAYALQIGEPTRLAEKVCESAGGSCGR